MEGVDIILPNCFPSIHSVLVVITKPKQDSSPPFSAVLRTEEWEEGSPSFPERLSSRVAIQSSAILAEAVHDKGRAAGTAQPDRSSGAGPSPASITFDLRPKSYPESNATASLADDLPHPVARSRRKLLIGGIVGLFLLFGMVLWVTRGQHKDNPSTASRSSFDLLSHPVPLEGARS